MNEDMPSGVYVKTPSVVRSKILYLMGATWHTKAMFDIDTREDSFSDLLNLHGMETITFDIIGTGLKDPVLPFGDHNESNISIARRLIEEHNIRNVIAYSYGIDILFKLIEEGSIFDRLMLLDPRAAGDPIRYFSDDDILIYKKRDILQHFLENKIKISGVILQEYINQMVNAPGGQLITPIYPRLLSNNTSLEDRADYLQREGSPKFKIVFSNQSREKVRELFDSKHVIYYDDASHYMLLEGARYKLADAAAELFLEY